jgi:hypothetical protein
MTFLVELSLIAVFLLLYALKVAIDHGAWR